MSTTNTIIRQAGVGHMHVLHLKDVYIDKIIPLIDKSYGTFTGFYLFRDLDPAPIDQQFLDTDIVSVYDNYRNPSSWNIDDTTKWWRNLDAFCSQAKSYNMTIIPTLFDFCCSPHDPFITKLEYPYTTYNWDDTIQGQYVHAVVNHIKSSEVNYILNLGSGYNQADPLLPEFGWLRKLVMYLIDNCGVPSDRLALSTNSNIDVDLYDKNPYCRYKTWTGSHVPILDEINNEEYVDGQWGGTGRVSVYDSTGKLIDGYVKYLTDDVEGVPCMNMWKMAEFVNNLPVGMPIDHPNAINYLFAPNQREAMRIVLGNAETNNGFIDFT